MRTLLALTLVAAVVGLSTAADDKKDPTTGKWVVELVTRDGKAVDALKGAVREHADGKYTLTPASGSKAAPTSGTYVLDLSKNPATIDMVVKGGTYDGKTLHGIAKLEGDTLTVAFGEPGKERPTKFESTAGSGVVVAVHKKVK
ncbi:TIGR03067 domain-containing protein [Gemmata sp. JC717]|uniref:TIGR03067 domain-containing protein n=1 Tax=Gemmata algarum TaxID=2975278 RepID=UPI0021BBB4E4|nr:TIGR03067 domain-containing protein [Gemmata algarum]MDY3555713.1 TIGR03067 domain-containing protein [Gemmata algarum]